MSQNRTENRLNEIVRHQLLADKIGIDIVQYRNTDGFILSFIRSIWSPIYTDSRPLPPFALIGPFWNLSTIPDHLHKFTTDYCFHHFGLTYNDGQEMLKSIYRDQIAWGLWMNLLDNPNDMAIVEILKDRLLELSC